MNLSSEPSPQLVAVMTLQHSKRYVEQRFDGAWWQLDFCMWSIIPELSPEEHLWAVRYIALHNQRRAERLA